MQKNRERQPAEAEILLKLFTDSFFHIFNYFSTTLFSKMEILEWYFLILMK